MTENQKNSNFYAKNKAIIIGITLFFLLICLSLYLAFIFFPENFNSVGAIIAFIETFFTSIVTYILNEAKKLEAEMKEKEKEREERTKQKEKEQAIQEREQDLKLYAKKIEACEEFLNVLESIAEDRIILISQSTDHKEDELNKIFFGISKLRMHFKQEDVVEVIYKCAKIAKILKKYTKSASNNLYYEEFSLELFEISKFFKDKLAPLKKDNEEETRPVVKDALRDFIGLVILDEEYEINLTNSSIDTVWHVNVGEESGLADKEQYRCWEDMKNFNFWSAGGAERYVKGVNKLEPGNTIYAYISGKGYVGKGEIKEKAKRVSEFFSDEEKKEEFASQLFKDHLNNPKFEGFHNPAIGEYAVKVKWDIVKERDSAYKGGINISPQTICLMNQKNLNKLKDEFK